MKFVMAGRIFFVKKSICYFNGHFRIEKIQKIFIFKHIIKSKSTAKNAFRF